ncbi:hypothetical protein IFM89_006526 [Coptis chinensis]|uniref:Thylakoid lumenal 17.9 kDa protein, chloroplastic n=1 Tax=Coptis chinensis TaxID=261450 RepID=A0A835ILD9_9MAGN|nr:hypothetical protein IFM89_006526 [Coptis chinensis]
MYTGTSDISLLSCPVLCSQWYFKLNDKECNVSKGGECSQIPSSSFQSPTTRTTLLSNLVSLTIAVTLNLNTPLPSLAIPSLNAQAPLLSPTTPFSEAKNLRTGLENGKIRPCPSTNPGCITTNPKSSSFTFPLTIPDNISKNAIQASSRTIFVFSCQYLQAEVDGSFGRDVLEFLIKGDKVVYRCMATKVTYVYPFTTALGDSKGQEERVKKIVDELGWYAPSYDSMD